MMTPEIFGKNISENRKKLGLTQKEVAEKLHLTPSAVSRWERGIGYPDINTISELADILEVPVETLLGTEEEKQNPAEEMLTIAIDQKKETEKKVRRKICALFLLFGITIFILCICVFPWKQRIQKKLYGVWFRENENTQIEVMISGTWNRYLFGPDDFDIEMYMLSSEDEPMYYIHSGTANAEYWNKGNVVSASGNYVSDVYFTEDIEKMILTWKDVKGDEIIVCADDSDYDFEKIKNMFAGNLMERLVYMWDRPKTEIMESMNWENVKSLDEWQQKYSIMLEEGLSLSYYLEKDLDSEENYLTLYFANNECDPEQRLIYFEYNIEITGASQNEICQKTYELMNSVEKKLTESYGEPDQTQECDHPDWVNRKTIIENMSKGEQITEIWNVTTKRNDEDLYLCGIVTLQPVFSGNTLKQYLLTIRFEKSSVAAANI